MKNVFQKTDKTLAKLTKKKKKNREREKIQTAKIRNDRRETLPNYG